MAKTKKQKEKKPRPDKYADKVAINATFDEVLHIFSDAAHDKVIAANNEEPAIQEPPTE